jgi:hypothetical protein
MKMKTQKQSGKRGNIKIKYLPVGKKGKMVKGGSIQAGVTGVQHKLGGSI